MYFPALIALFLSIILLPSTNCYSNLRPKTIFHWKTNSSDDHEISENQTAYWMGSAASNRFSTICCLSTATPSLQTGTKKHYVAVGENSHLAFTPTEVDASVGDVVIFTFLALNHTLTQSSLAEPCTNKGGFSTGFNQFNPKDVSGEFVVEYRVDTMKPQWFFCAQTSRASHCKAGMVFALNAGGKMSAFVSAATQTSENKMWTGTVVPTSSISTASSILTIQVEKPSDATVATTIQTSGSSGLSNLSNSSVRVSQTPASSVAAGKQVGELLMALTQVVLLLILFMGL